MSESHDDAAPAAQTRLVESLLEARGLLDPQELDRALEGIERAAQQTARTATPA